MCKRLKFVWEYFTKCTSYWCYKSDNLYSLVNNLVYFTFLINNPNN